jgi:trans-2-enoyl-CoA reductase
LLTFTQQMAKERLIYFKSPGAAATVLSAATISALPEPSGTSVNLKVLLAPINPSDIGIIRGGVPLRPAETKLSSGQTVYVPGNEGLGQVEQVGPDVKGLSKGDWVIFARLQCGTWRSGLTVAENDVIKVGPTDGLSDVQAATLAVSCSFHVEIS